MTATVGNAVFSKHGVTITVQVTDYSENYNVAVTRSIPKIKTTNDRPTDPSQSDYATFNKSDSVILSINPEQRLTINGYLITETGSFTDSYGAAIDKKDALKRMFLNTGNVSLVLETGGSVPTAPFFTNVIVDKWEFKKLPLEGRESLHDGVVEYSVTISCVDSDEYGV